MCFNISIHQKEVILHVDHKRDACGSVRLAIPNEELSRLNVDHGLITGAQMKAYKAFAATGKTLTWETVSTIETNALIKGGMEQSAARATVTEAITNLKQSGVTAPTKIPWGGK
ncbi:hypothetical protein HDF18_01245 [Mucilaginibacter sp. X5P1]|uniref:hypothetical protein n=1 Tax=Mucilaginibacter sp. X5P1 TaxID=2723088 RepID=UPI001621B4A4|nr:hypothetical protein [Mucilaginibacter sp. X5P1]MBB6138271.1 hypothetical protein [Mucilaginibacter sp. X5P1]